MSRQNAIAGSRTFGRGNASSSAARPVPAVATTASDAASSASPSRRDSRPPRAGGGRGRGGGARQGPARAGAAGTPPGGDPRGWEIDRPVQRNVGVPSPASPPSPLPRRTVPARVGSPTCSYDPHHRPPP